MPPFFSRFIYYFQILLAIDKVINQSSLLGPPHGANPMKYGSFAIAVPFLECSYLKVILAKPPHTGNIKHGVPY